jgi:hypothetical protein
MLTSAFSFRARRRAGKTGGGQSRYHLIPIHVERNS